MLLQYRSKVAFRLPMSVSALLDTYSRSPGCVKKNEGPFNIHPMLKARILRPRK